MHQRTSIVVVFLITIPAVFLFLANNGWGEPSRKMDRSGSSGLDAVLDNEKNRGVFSPGMKAAIASLSSIEGLRIFTDENGAVLQGELLSHMDLRKIHKVSARYDGVTNLCTIHPDALVVASRFMESALETAGIQNVNLEVIGGMVLVTGSPQVQEDVTMILDLLEAYDLPYVNGIRMNGWDHRMIMFEVHFTEISSEAMESLGVGWPSAVNLKDPAGFHLARLSPSASLEATINTFIQQGKARIISRPRLLCRSGEKASFQAGGEIPIPKSGKDGEISVTWKPYGIILEVSPKVDSSGAIFTGILSEVSTVDRANAVGGIPGILSRRIETSLTLSEGEIVIMSGLVSSEDAETIRKFPLLGDIPVIGELFKSIDFQERKSELVVFITPSYAGHGDSV